MIPVRTLVTNRQTNIRGVVIEDRYGLCGDDDVLVIYANESGAEATDMDILTIHGPEDAQADFKKCGGGRGSECCIFLVASPDGMECARFGSLRETLIGRKRFMNAQREPTAMFPDCQLPEETI